MFFWWCCTRQFVCKYYYFIVSQSYVVTLTGLIIDGGSLQEENGLTAPTDGTSSVELICHPIAVCLLVLTDQ